MRSKITFMESRPLLRWYRAHKRDLPWRKTRDPYAIWISEIMLQQTQVAAVIPYYKRFLKKFPNIRSLARAPEKEVLRLWAGLGYYSRARNLHRAAREIIRRHGGSFPRDYASILDLPGIGRYTAGAVASIAFHQPYPVLDGNVARVLARLFAVRRDIKSPAGQKKLWDLAQNLVNKNAPGDWNQALMELGAVICLPENPRCLLCPVRKNCTAFKKGLQKKLPVSSKDKKPVSLAWQAVIARRKGSILLSKGGRQGLLKNHWGLPSPSDIGSPADLKPAGRVTHNITHHRITLDLYETPPPRAVNSTLKWVPIKKLSRFLISSLWRKALRLK